MNKDDIKKALKMCISSDPCDNCPYKADGRCSDTLKTDALNLIIEQEKEIANSEEPQMTITRSILVMAM